MTTEELFEEMSSQQEAFSDAEEYCMLQTDTSRVLLIPDRFKTLGVESDESVERVKFKLPKIVGDNVDLSTLGIRINYRNADKKAGKYEVTDVSEEGEYITFSWVIRREVVKTKGSVQFIVCAIKADLEGNIHNEWNTTLNSDCKVLEGLEVDSEIAEENPDIIEAILVRLSNLESGSGGGSGSGTPGADGKDGREIELQNSGVFIQWRYVGEEDWNDLVPLSDLKGEKGDPGQNGVTPNLSIGEVTTLEPEQQATASITGTPEQPLLNLGIPKGKDGGVESGDYVTTDALNSAIGKVKTVEVSEATPESENVQLWIDPSSEESFNVPEVKDEEVNTDDTWSSKKISDELSKKVNLNQGAENKGKFLGVDNSGNVIPKDAPTSSGGDYTLPIMSEEALGGGKAITKTEETVPVAVDPETGQLFVPTYPEAGGGSSEKEWKELLNVTVEDNSVVQYTADTNGCREFYVYIIFGNDPEITVVKNGTIALDSEAWASNNKVINIIGGLAYKEGQNGKAILIHFEITNDGYELGYTTFQSTNTAASMAYLGAIGPSFGPLNKTEDYIMSIKKINPFSQISIGSYTKYFGVNSQILILGR